MRSDKLSSVTTVGTEPFRLDNDKLDKQLPQLRFPLVSTPYFPQQLVHSTPEGGRSKSGAFLINETLRSQIAVPALWGKMGTLAGYDSYEVSGWARKADGPGLGADTMRFVILDDANCGDANFYERLRRMNQCVGKLETMAGVVVPEWFFVNDLTALKNVEAIAVSKGASGLILRDPNAPFVPGKTTLVDQSYMRLTRWSPIKATVVGFDRENPAKVYVMQDGIEFSINLPLETMTQSVEFDDEVTVMALPPIVPGAPPSLPFFVSSRKPSQ